MSVFRLCVRTGGKPHLFQDLSWVEGGIDLRGYGEGLVGARDVQQPLKGCSDVSEHKTVGGAGALV